MPAGSGFFLATASLQFWLLVPALVHLTLHDLLQLHLQGLDGASRMISHSAFDPVDGQTTFWHSSDVVVFQEDDPVRVFNHGTVTGPTRGKNTNVWRRKQDDGTHTLHHHWFKTSVSNMIAPNIFNNYNTIIQPVSKIKYFYCIFIILSTSSPSYKPKE